MPEEFTGVPEADALEQRLEVGTTDEDVEAPTVQLDASEADALEQSRAVPLDDGYESRA